MKTLSTPITTEHNASQSGWSELYDFYLKASITTPFGTTNVLRICTNPAGVNFFTPKISPETSGTQGAAQTYSFWPLKRQMVKGSSKFTNDKLAIAASNVSQEWAQMLADVDWEAVPVVIRKVSNSLSSATADDCAVIFSGSIDSVKVTLEQLNFTVSNDFGTFNLLAPRENMHANCRFNYADDQCTQMLYRASNFKTMSVGSGSTVTNVKSADLTQDTGTLGNYGADLVDSLLDANITASSEAGAIANQDVAFGAPGFAFTSTDPEIGVNAIVTFTATTMPTHSGGAAIVAGTNYYVVRVDDFGFTKGCQIALTGGGAALSFNTFGSGVKCSSPIGNRGFNVKWSKTGFWSMLSTDWGTNSQGYWELPDSDQGLRNANLKPWVTFDFGAGNNRQMKLWRICGRQDRDRESLPRLALFSSPDNATWKFESYFEMPPQFNAVASPQLFDVLIPNATGNRYWRICVRSRWSDTMQTNLFFKVRGYEGSRHFWQNGQITFASNTTTPTLRNVTRTVSESYAGELICAALPAAPVSGDTFTIQRGCARTFNACCARGNWENFGGFDSMPFETVIR